MLEAGGIGICCPELVDACVHIRLVSQPGLMLRKDRHSWMDPYKKQMELDGGSTRQMELGSHSARTDGAGLILKRGRWEKG